MEAHRSLNALLRAALVAGALAASLGASAAFADHAPGHGRPGSGDATPTPSATATDSPAATATGTVVATATSTMTAATATATTSTTTTTAAATATATPSANTQASQGHGRGNQGRGNQGDDEHGAAAGQGQSDDDHGDHGMASLEHRHGISGVLVKVDGNVLTLDTKWDDTFLVMVVPSGDDATEFHMAGENDAVAFSALTAATGAFTMSLKPDGDKLRLNVNGEWNDAGQFMADHVNVHQMGGEGDH